MHRNTTGWLILLALIVFCSSAGTASAMSAFSRKYKMQCDGCHRKRIPELNEFGIEFYKNGFVLSKQDDATKTGAGQGEVGVPDTTGGKAPAKGEPGTPAKAGTNDATDDSGEEEPPPKPEVPPTVVYRSKSPEGTLFFTNTPERRTDFYWKQDNGEEEPAASRVEKTVRPKKGKPAVSRQQAERPGKPGSMQVVEKEKFRSYEECMERQLIGAKQPDSAREMMDLMMAAEERCSDYPLEKR